MKIFAVLALALTLALTACRSYHIDITVQNQTGAPVRLLEVDYPYASFGVDTLASGATFHYRISVQGNGPLKVQYTAPDGHQPQVKGPELVEKQEGALKIQLLPGGKAEFHPLSAPNH